MNGSIINIDPVIFRIGDFELRWYSVVIILAVVVAIVIAAREGKRKGMPKDFFYSVAPWVLIAGLAGARLFHVIDQWEYYAGEPASHISGVSRAAWLSGVVCSQEEWQL